MFDQPAYTVEEGGIVDVVVQLCGSINDDVIITFMTNDDTAGTAWPLLNDRICIYIYIYLSLDVSFTVDISIIVDCACNHSF